MLHAEARHSTHYTSDAHATCPNCKVQTALHHLCAHARPHKSLFASAASAQHATPPINHCTATCLYAFCCLLADAFVVLPVKGNEPCLLCICSTLCSLWRVKQACMISVCIL